MIPKQRQPGRKARAVGEQIAYGDRFAIGTAPFRYPPRNRIAKTEAAGVHKPRRQRRCDDHLRQRGKIKDGFWGRRRRRRFVTQSAERFAPENVPTRADFDDRRRKRARCDRAVQNGLRTFGVKA